MNCPSTPVPDEAKLYAYDFASSYGDPHFHILGSDETHPDICFDVDGKPGQTLLLIEDKNTGFSVTGTLYQIELKLMIKMMNSVRIRDDCENNYEKYNLTH